MKSRILYDSVFGNTEEIAKAMYNAINANIDTEISRVNDTHPQDLLNYDLLIVGSPTRAFSPTPSTSKLLKQIKARGLKDTFIAAFDTRMEIDKINSKFLKVMEKLFGYAAKPIADLLIKKGGKLVAPPEGFIVDGEQGPLKAGELERAANWAKTLLTQIED